MIAHNTSIQIYMYKLWLTGDTRLIGVRNLLLDVFVLRWSVILCDDLVGCLVYSEMAWGWYGMKSLEAHLLLFSISGHAQVVVFHVCHRSLISREQFLPRFPLSWSSGYHVTMIPLLFMLKIHNLFPKVTFPPWLHPVKIWLHTVRKHKSFNCFLRAYKPLSTFHNWPRDRYND